LLPPGVTVPDDTPSWILAGCAVTFQLNGRGELASLIKTTEHREYLPCGVQDEEICSCRFGEGKVHEVIGVDSVNKKISHIICLFIGNNPLFLMKCISVSCSVLSSNSSVPLAAGAEELP
jgi:hypothetical protein